MMNCVEILGSSPLPTMPMQFAVSLLEAVQSYRKIYAAGKSNTARAKTYDLRYFEEFLFSVRGNCSIHDITTDDLREYLIHLSEERGDAISTIERRWATVSAMFRFLATHHRGFHSPCAGIVSPRAVKLEPKRLTPEEERTIRLAALAHSPTLHCLVEVFLGTGFRLDEVRRLSMGNIDFKRAEIVGLIEKGRSSTDRAISKTTLEVMKAYLPVRERKLWEAQKRNYDRVPESVWMKYPYFVSTYGANAKDPLKPSLWRLSHKAIYSNIADLGRSCGVDLHPHLLRHTFAKKILDESNDIRLTMQMLGHRKIESTIRYTERSMERAHEVVNRVAGSR